METHAHFVLIDVLLYKIPDGMD